MTDLIQCPLCNGVFDERAIGVHASKCLGENNHLNELSEDEDRSDFEEERNISDVSIHVSDDDDENDNNPFTPEEEEKWEQSNKKENENNVEVVAKKLKTEGKEQTFTPQFHFRLCDAMQLIENALLFCGKEDYNNNNNNTAQCFNVAENFELLKNLQKTLEKLSEAYEDEVYFTRKQTQKELEEFSIIRLQLEQAQSVLSGKQQDELAKIRNEELEKRENEIKKEKQRLQQEFQQLQHNTTQLVQGEKEALETNKLRYFPLLLSQTHNTSPEAMHFRIAESAFYRLNSNNAVRVTKVEYIVNPILLAQFNAERERDSSLKPMLVFHGTDPKNIHSICSEGFRKPGDPKYHTANGQVRGPGVYFAESVTVSVGYNATSDKMLLVQILAKPSEDKGGGVWVLKDSERALPTYIIHHKTVLLTDPSQLYKTK
jgi:hypothetical protein